MIERVERPDLDEYRVGVAECCGSRAGERFCESFGCRSITELLAYALQLEQDAAALRERLRAIEWGDVMGPSKVRPVPDHDLDSCYYCEACRVEGHEEDCRLAAALLAAGS